MKKDTGWKSGIKERGHNNQPQRTAWWLIEAYHKFFEAQNFSFNICLLFWCYFAVYDLFTLLLVHG